MFLFACVCVRVCCCCCCLRWVVLLLLLCVVPRLRSTQQNNPERVAGTNNDEGSNIRGHGIPALLPLTRNKSAPVTRAKPKILPQTNHARAKNAPARTKEHMTEFKARVNAEMKTARKMLAKLKRNCNISSGKVKQQQSKLFDSLDTILENLYTLSCKPNVADKSLDNMALCQICVNTAVRF